MDLGAMLLHIPAQYCTALLNIQQSQKHDWAETLRLLDDLKNPVLRDDIVELDELDSVLFQQQLAITRASQAIGSLTNCIQVLNREYREKVVVSFFF